MIPMIVTIHKYSSYKFDISFVQVPTTLCITENCFSQLCKLFESSNKRQYTNFTFL